MFKELNPLLHSELRLAVMSLLISVEEADFVLKEKCLVHFVGLLRREWMPLKNI